MGSAGPCPRHNRYVAAAFAIWKGKRGSFLPDLCAPCTSGGRPARKVAEFGQKSACAVKNRLALPFPTCRLLSMATALRNAMQTGVLPMRQEQDQLRLYRRPGV